MALDAVRAVDKGYQSTGRGYRLVLPLLLVLLAFLLRVYHLDFQSLWSDEGISLLRSSQPLGEMLRQMPVEHVPGYFVLLNLWLPLAGATDFALRWPSLIPSVLVVALAYRLGADLGSRPAGAAAALLLGTGMFQVWYGQEARMYSWLLATGCGSTWFLWRMLPQAGRMQPAQPGDARAPGVRRTRSAAFWAAWAGYVLCTAATIYLHIYGFFVPAAQTAFMVLWLALTRDWRGFARWAAAGAAVVLLYLPWAPRFLGIFGFPGWRQGLDPLALPWRYLAAYTAGDAMPAPWHTWLPWLYLALALLGLWAWWRQERLAAVLLSCVTALPFAGAFVLALRQPDYHERYTIFISAPLVLLAARGLWPFAPQAEPGAGHMFRKGLRNVLPAALLAGLVMANSAAVLRLYTDPAVQKADYKTPIRRIEENAQAGDVILLDGPEPEQIFLHYYHGQLPWFDLRPALKSSDAEAAAAMQAATDGKRRAWVLRHYHDEGPAQAWLARNAWPADQTYYGGLYFNTYGLPAMVTRTLPAGQTFGPALKLARAELAGGAVVVDQVQARAGDLLGVTTEWQVTQAPPPLKFSLRLQDRDGRRWAAEDYVPQAGFAPTEGWQPGQTVTDRHALWLPPDLPPGPYDVALVLYDPATGQPLETGHSPVLGAVQAGPAARPPDPQNLPIPVRLDARPLNPELALLGYGIAPQPLRAGEDARLTVWWQARGRPAKPYQLLVELSRGGRFAARKLYPLSALPADAWEEGQVLRAEYPLEFNPAAPSGTYNINLTLVDAGGEPLGPPLAAGSAAFAARDRSYRLPQISHLVDAHLGEAIMLRGYDLELPQATAGDVALTLVWQATAPEHAAYKVFVHMLDEKGQTVAQSDAVPAGGAAPTESWLANEVVIDTHKLAAPKPGRYRLLAGLYNPNTGQRPAARDGAGQPLPDGAIPLTEFELP